MAASSSTSANPNKNHGYDVFLNHRGPDVKKTFASHLYRRLLSHGVSVFLDQQELQQGDSLTSQIERAIKTASIHVAIFSPRYAESPWCLNELILMWESKATIIPVFYSVKPTELRWTQGKDGVYAKSLHILETKRKYDSQTNQETLRHDSATVEHWRKALSFVAGLSGFELEACNSDEGELVDKVVESVLKKVKKTPLNVAKYPKGLDEKVKDFENKVLLRHQESGRMPQVVGIVGLGGVGKTTLAKELFNRKRSHYSRSCFLYDVRENAGKDSLISLQRKILKSLTGADLHIDNKDEGIETLKMHLSSSQILLILDDVDHVDQVYALLPDQTFLLSNSLILITSRNKDVLTNSGVEKTSIYKLNGLGEEHSLELFCCHAFDRPYPLPKFRFLAQEFLNACGGLPLSLKVFGALLRGKNDRSYWQDQLDRLKNILPSEIQERLKISFEALNEEEKQMFLDTACFFIGQNKNQAISIWNPSRWKGRLGFQILQAKCLVEVDHSNIIHMHDHLRDVGRDLAGSSWPRRFCRCTESVIEDLLQQSSNGQVIPVRGIKMVLSEYHDDDEFEGIRMGRLQLVDTEGPLLECIMKRVKAPNLIWLRWKECPYSSMPSWISMKNLRILEVSGSRLETLWQHESQLPVCLEELKLNRCMQLKSIRVLTQLTKLQRLYLLDCIELEELPTIETLISLEELWADGCVKVKRIPGLAQCTMLQRLSVSGCPQLEELPSMKTFLSLKELRASGCVKLKSISGLELATKLQMLDVTRCVELEAFSSTETLVSLKWLCVGGCVKLKNIRGLGLVTKLQLLDVSGCSELEDLPSMETLVCLERLCADGCVKLKKIRGLELATKLSKLCINGCSELKELPSMEQATKLRILDVSRCSKLDELPSMETFVALEELWADGCVKLKSIRGLELATKLRKLSVNGCSELVELPSMETLVSLQGLWVEGCVKLKSIKGLEQATRLQLLDVSGCSHLEELPSMETFVVLEELLAEGCVKLTSIRGLAHCTKLKRLIVFGCSELEQLPSIETLVSLKEMLQLYIPAFLPRIDLFFTCRAHARQYDGFLRFTNHTEVHTVVIGYGSGSFGAHLFSKKFLTVCIAMYELYGSQVQLALEKGLPAMLASFISRQLPYPPLSFDMVHCARCSIDWEQKDGAFLIEADRVHEPEAHLEALLGSVPTT